MSEIILSNTIGLKISPENLEKFERTFVEEIQGVLYLPETKKTACKIVGMVGGNVLIDVSHPMCPHLVRITTDLDGNIEDLIMRD